MQKISVDLSVFALEWKSPIQRDIYSHQRAVNQTWLTLWTPLRKKKHGPGLVYLAARFLLGHPAGQPVFFLYSGHRGAAPSEQVRPEPTVPRLFVLRRVRQPGIPTHPFNMATLTHSLCLLALLTGCFVSFSPPPSLSLFLKVEWSVLCVTCTLSTSSECFVWRGASVCTLQDLQERHREWRKDYLVLHKTEKHFPLNEFWVVIQNDIIDCEDGNKTAD